MIGENAEVCAVTGSTGYVGTLIAQELRQTRRIAALTRRAAAADEVAWSFESESDVAEALRRRGVKTLVHAAWDMRASDRRQMEAVCVQGSERLLTAAARAGIKRIVFISTISAFEGCRSAYGQSKVAIEKMVQSMAGGIVLRPGLVYGPAAGSPPGSGSGGVFGSIQQQVGKSHIVPLIGDGRAPQYLLDADTLANTVARAVSGEFDGTAGSPITLAHPQPWPFRDLVQSIAAAEGRHVTLIPVPWRLLYSGARLGELAGVKLPFRSDSILSFVYSNPVPDFSALQRLHIVPKPYISASI